MTLRRQWIVVVIEGARKGGGSFLFAELVYLAGIRRDDKT